MTALAAYGRLRLLPGYRLVSGGGSLEVHRADNSVVAAFVASAAPSGVVRTAEDDYRAAGETGTAAREGSRQGI